ncbi:RNA-directed DNA polymerase [Moraxella sp. K127]|uniref:antiviral reverse transcriptase Drt3a n=1 Tax=Moraxella TaxID=475 RepID=UPI0018819F56|nr:RNA-directed DNA polymerase [Moraxella sp. K127]
MLDQSINLDSLKFALNDYEKNFLFNDYFQHGEDEILLELINDYRKNKPIRAPMKGSLKGKSVYSYCDLREYLFQKRFITSFKSINKVTQQNRNEIVLSIIALIQEHKPYSILRLDIKSFYESIDRTDLLEKIKRDKIYSVDTVKILERFFECFEREGILGLPRGLPMSAILAEYYMRSFDKACKRMDDVFFYARFVDDIIIFTTNQEVRESDLEDKLPEGLQFNTQKSKIIKFLFDRSSTPIKESFSYLGYQFTIDCKKNKINSYIDIAPEKIKKIKTRIIKSFLDYNKNKNFDLLLKRIKFLTSNYFIYNKNRDTKIKSGIYYNYKYITIEKIDKYQLSLYSLDKLLQSIIFNIKVQKDILGCEHWLSNDEKDKLSKYKFINGFKFKKIQKLSRNPKEFKRINRCWSY